MFIILRRETQDDFFLIIAKRNHISNILFIFAVEHLGRADGCSPRTVCGGCRPLLLELGNGIFGTTPLKPIVILFGPAVWPYVEVIYHSARCKHHTANNEKSVSSGVAIGAAAHSLQSTTVPYRLSGVTKLTNYEEVFIVFCSGYHNYDGSVYVQRLQ